MAKTRSMTRNRNYDDDDDDNDASGRKRIKSRNKGVVSHWSDLDHDLLLLIIKRLGVVDFLLFSGVCKSWRSLALCNRKRFMASKPPMSMWISSEDNKKDYCNLKDFEGRKFKTLLPSFSGGRKCVGVTCGYLVFFGERTKDFWLVNLITRHELHFPGFPDDHGDMCNLYKAIKVTLVFSHSISGWLLVITEIFWNRIWFSVAGEGAWNHVSSTSYIYNLHVFRGKIYTLNMDFDGADRHLCEMRLGPEPKFMVLETKNFPKRNYVHFVASYGENLYVVEYMLEDYFCKVHKLDFGEMKWVLYSDDEKTKTDEEFAFYRNHMGYITVVKQESWAGTYKSRKSKVNLAHFWYFPHDCLNANPID